MAQQPKSRARERERRSGARQRPTHGLLLPHEIEGLRAWAVAALQEGDRAGALVVALLGTAGRRFEVAALRAGDVREGPGGPEVRFPETKGGGEAVVPVTPETFRLLRSWVVAQGLAARDPLLPSMGGGFMHTTTVWRAFRVACRQAGIARRVGVHATRHAGGFLLLRATGDITKVQAFLRHASPATTHAWYKHIHVPDLRAGLERAGL